MSCWVCTLNLDSSVGIMSRLRAVRSAFWTPAEAESFSSSKYPNRPSGSPVLILSRCHTSFVEVKWPRHWLRVCGVCVCVFVVCGVVCVWCVCVCLLCVVWCGVCGVVIVCVCGCECGVCVCVCVCGVCVCVVWVCVVCVCCVCVCVSCYLLCACIMWTITSSSSHFTSCSSVYSTFRLGSVKYITTVFPAPWQIRSPLVFVL